jgi:hypothetical protein
MQALRLKLAGADCAGAGHSPCLLVI